jgi:hypothetical protein
MESSATMQSGSSLEARSLANVEHCERLAAIMLTPAQRESYLEMARMWRKLANEAGNHRLRVAAWSRKVSAPKSHALDGDESMGAG